MQAAFPSTKPVPAPQKLRVCNIRHMIPFSTVWRGETV